MSSSTIENTNQSEVVAIIDLTTDTALPTPPKMAEKCDHCNKETKEIQNESESDLIDIECKQNKEIKRKAEDVSSSVVDDVQEVPSKFLDEPEVSLVQIHEKMIEKADSIDSNDERDFIEVYQEERVHHCTPLDDSESEEDDKLRPLMVDNHTIRELCGLNAMRSACQGRRVMTLADLPQKVSVVSETSPSTKSQVVMKHSETSDSITSTDSDVSSFNYNDRRNSSSSQPCNDSSSSPNDSTDKQYSSSDDYAKDSGVEVKTLVSTTTTTTTTTTATAETVEVKEIDTLCPSEIPDDKLSEEIVEQVEFYFSNENILKDAFLLKHVRRNKEGFVSLKLVSSFKRVRQITKDWRVVGHAILKKGRNVELNDIATKVRRLETLPNFDETMPSRTIVATDIPVDKLTIERVSEIFSKCGEIALIRILRPGQTIPTDVRQFVNKYPETQQKECALVEFVESHSARHALNLTVNFKIYEMVAPKKKTGKKATAVTVTKLIEHYKYHDGNCERNRGGNVILQNQNPNMMNTGFVGNMIHQNENDFSKFKLRRNNSADYYVRPEQQYVCPQRKYSFNSNNVNATNAQNMDNAFSHFSPRRLSANNCQQLTSDMIPRKYSSCSEGYSSCSEQVSRRTSTCSSDQSRRTSSCSEYCPCSRRMSQCSDTYRRISNCSEHNNIAINNMNNNNNNNSNNIGFINNRKYSAGQVPYERNFPTSQSPMEMGRRTSIDSSYDRKLSSGSVGSNNGQYENYRKYSNGFDPNRKLSNTDQYFNGRRVSTDSGYDRKLSFGSDYSTSPRSRSNSFMICQHKNGDSVVRTPIGPDGSKGFASRTRKVGQIVLSPV